MAARRMVYRRGHLSQLSGGKAGTNLIAHLSGAALGFLLGCTLFRAKRHWAHELVEE